MNLMTKKDFNIFVDTYLKEVEKHQIERVYFHFSCGYTKKEAKEAQESLELIEYNTHDYTEPTWVWHNDWDEGQKFVCAYGVYKESDIIKILSDYYDEKEELKPLPKQLNCCTPMRSICDTCRKVFVCPMQHIEHREKCGLYEPLPNPLDECITETRSLNPIKEENKMESWKERLKEEYAQLKERYEKLRTYNNKKEIETYLMGDCCLKPEEYHNNRLLKEQQHVMGEYLHILELRAELAHIEL